MERVAFIVEASGRRIDCLLNPEALTLKRRAGVHPRWGRTRPITGALQQDDPVLFTGGGVTELDLKLLFDVTLAPEGRQVRDVRELTGPLWELAESTDASANGGRPPLVRFVWGKSWNMPGVVLAVAERHERFTSTGVPGRSWLRVRLRRLAPSADRHVDPEARDAAQSGEATTALEALQAADSSSVPVQARHEVGGEDSQRLDEIAASHYGNPALWRAIALHNGIDDPGAIAPGTVIELPAFSSLRRLR